VSLVENKGNMIIEPHIFGKVKGVAESGSAVSRFRRH